MIAIRRITESVYFKAILGILGCFIAAAIIFAAGVHVGERRAKYSYQWGANYERNFLGGPPEMVDGPRGPMGKGGFEEGPLGMMRNFEGRDFRNGHGIAGTITSVSDSSIIIKDRDGKENTVAVSDKTLIKKGQADIKIGELGNDEKIVVVGKPSEDGTINADLIRVFEDGNFQK